MKHLRSTGFFIFFVALTYVYLWPGSEALRRGETTQVMSDGGDPVPLPYAYDQIVTTFHNDPWRFLYGAVHVPHGDPDRGLIYWMPWSERWLVLLSSWLFPLEQLSTAFIFALFVLNALAMMGMGRAFGWPRWLSLGLAVAWAFNPFTRARAKVHGAMVGIYHLPLIFWALRLVTRKRDRRSLLVAAALFLGAATTAHYFLVTTLFLSPFFVLYILLTPEFRREAHRITTRLVLAVLPALLFLGFGFAFPVPNEARVERADSLPRSGETVDGKIHPYLHIFAARPIDFLAGDLGLTGGAKDLNPWREIINDHILHDPTTGNAHERTNGIRWSILILALAGSAWVLWSTRKHAGDKSDVRRQIFFFTVFGLAGFWLSLAPPETLPSFGPSYWLHSLVSQVRVPCRAGIVVHFSCLVLAGLALHALAKDRSSPWTAGFLFITLILIDYPPYQDMNMARIQPAYASLQRDKGTCGTGMYFPFVSPHSNLDGLYFFVQKFRGSDCGALNLMQNYGRAKYLFDRFPPTMEFVKGLPDHPESARQLIHVATCAPLAWIAFDPSVAENWAQSVCSTLEWTFIASERVCVSPNRAQPIARFPDECP
jgi:hypothetical protein